MRIQGTEKKKKKCKGSAYAASGDEVMQPKENWRARFRKGLRGWMMQKSKKWKKLMEALE